ncbi:efflux RND transporter permease subunit [Thalassotalea sp. LPB0316]|uniref:efflux RND transporter permease subunit n=1 Tax=Thalassotalea sp. LPB0316 TaxID=2769490 RepID=UPI001866C6D2|nr:efflux RND transporter permease subunit [Thalassotalea sp. LPB0316]QOL26324.1 efflux RND transporter permease subunit [Thalassotalea sp. LPB0316]
MIAWFAKNSVAANLLMAFILVIGLGSLSTKIPLEVFPSVESEVISVRISLRGATPEDVEKGVTIRIEEAVQDLEGIERIVSSSSENSSSVNIEVESGYDPREMLADVKSRVDAINTFPVDAEKPIIALAQRKREVIAVTVTSPYSEKETLEFAEVVRDELLRLPGVTQLDLSGVRNYEISLTLSQDQLRQYGLTINEVSRQVNAFSTDVSAGNLRSSGGDILLRSKGQAYYKDEFADIPIKTRADGTIIRLRDVATINDGFEETPIRTRFNGQQAAFIDVYRIGQQSAIEVADQVKAYIDRRQDTLPEGFALSYWDDDSEIVKNRIATLTSSALQGGFLVLLLLTLFLRPSIAFWVFIGIPVSFMGAFIFMPVFGVTLNIMSLFGFILVLGIVVDDAIVTGENIYTHLRNAESGEEAAIKGTQEVATPVTFGILTTVTAFLPMLFIEGRRGALFSQIAIVVIPVLIFSLIESKFVLPAHLKKIKLRGQSKPNRLERFQQRFADGFERAILKFYQPLLSVALRNKMTTISLFVGTFLIIIALLMSGWSKFVFFPRIPSETVRLNLTMPNGTPFEVTNQHIINIAAQAEKLQQKYVDKETNQSVIMNVLATTGGRGGTSHVGGVRFELVPPEKRTINVTSRQMVAEWRQLVGQIPGAESMTYRAEIGRSSDPIDVQLTGNSLETLQEVANKVKLHLATYPTVFDIADSLSDGKEELQIELTQQGKALGLSRQEVASQVRNAYFGAQAQRIQRGRDDVRVMVLLPIEERRSLADLKHILIDTPSGAKVPLSHIAELIPGKSPSTIRRIDRYRTVNVTADIDKQTANMTALNADLKVFLDNLVAQYPGINHSLEGEAKEQRESFGSLGWGLLFVFFVIYALLAIPFKSYIQPLIVMSVIPFGLIGAFIGHWIMGMDLTLFSLLGMLALIGVVVNDSLVLVDFINKKKQQGYNIANAVLTAGASRFRPVMLTSLTTFIGLMPLLFEKSTQAQFLIPMAISLGFGILFATFITLILVPVNYLVVERLKGNKVKTEELILPARAITS